MARRASPVTRPACQRWNGRAQSWRHPADGGFDPSRYWAARIEPARAKAFVTAHHYSGTYPAWIANYGMFETDTGELVGVAVLSTPGSPAVLPSVFPALEPSTESADLGRFVLLDKVPANAESWLLGEVRRQAAETGMRGLVMFSDPVERRRADASIVTPGHVGTIYQASGCRYLGLSAPSTEWVLPDGTVFSRRAAQKVRKQDRGHRYAEMQLIAWGARPMRAGEDPAAWLAEALVAAGAVRFRHPGKHRYAIALGRTRRERAAVTIAGRPGAYPKRHLGQLDLFACGDGLEGP